MRRRVTGPGGIVRWETDPAFVDDALPRTPDAIAALVDELITSRAAWARIEEHAAAAARSHKDPWARDVFAILSGCAAILAGDRETERETSCPQAVRAPSDDAATVRDSTTAPVLDTPGPSATRSDTSGRGLA